MNKMKIRVTVIAVLAIIITIMAQGTLAYYSTGGTSTNVVTTGDIQLVIHETTASGRPFPRNGMYVLPGQTVSKIVTIENDCSHPFYLRVKLTTSINAFSLSSYDCFNIDLNSDDWILMPDGYIYYSEILQPGETTSPVFTEVEIDGTKVDYRYAGRTLSLTVNAYAVQSENNPARYPWDAVGWPVD